MDILYLLDRLENLLAGSRRMPLTNQLLLKESDILSIVDEMRSTIPNEIQQARRIVQDKERILAQANAEAANIVSRSRAESERAMNREGLLRAAEGRSQELLRQAEEQAQELVRQAKRNSEHLKNDADAYVSETLQGLKEHLTSIETEVSRTILSIDRGLESIALQVSDEDEEEDDMAYEILEDEAEGNDEPQQQEEIQPRRASLANDTIGGPSLS